METGAEDKAEDKAQSLNINVTQESEGQPPSPSKPIVKGMSYTHQHVIQLYWVLLFCYNQRFSKGNKSYFVLSF